ncbi:DUF2752 domain-containing protein [Mycolicibacterium arseniciresistens]|uniref:DUF2752 domain-containing protein n=1 Tax=Mycolicibacterium arseniciresistens TaxID=3062257 RepID=A0ABT8UHG3_9MYCO|nr:DUF2752 domain-containing protein [Mycolicibacterium arseniciresistens]MDO3637217.1 DUF2752 domain-containing protein [Mycolicibacterium arseniciresistens]
MTDRYESEQLPRRVGVAVRRHDPYPVWTWLAVAGLVSAAVMAVVGLPDVDLHGPLCRLGVMCPLCGGTRGVYLTLQGELGQALRYNPASPVLVAAALALLIRAVIGWSSGRWLVMALPRRIWIPVGVVAVIALWVNQQLNAELLTQPWG